MVFLPHLNNAGVGVKSGYQLVKSSLELGLLLYLMSYLEE
jgi:hypothetical protein